MQHRRWVQMMDPILEKHIFQTIVHITENDMWIQKEINEIFSQIQMFNMRPSSNMEYIQSII